MPAPNPAHPQGALHWVFLGTGGALVALVVATFFPSLIPARATQTKL